MLFLNFGGPSNSMYAIYNDVLQVTTNLLYLECAVWNLSTVVLYCIMTSLFGGLSQKFTVMVSVTTLFN